MHSSFRSLCLSMVLAHAALAQPMFNSLGERNASYQVNQFTEEYFEKAGDLPPDDDELLDWNATVRERVAQGEQLLRWTPPDDLDKLAQSQQQSQINQQYRRLVADLPGRRVDARVEVESVIERRPPVPPGPLPANAMNAQKQLFQQQAEEYERRVAQYKRERYCVVVRLPWQQDAPPLPLATRKKLSDMPTAARGAELTAWRAQVPVHRVYFLTGDESVSRWKPGQARRLQGRLQRLDVQSSTPRTMRLYDAGPTCRYVQIEACLTDVVHDLPLTDPPAAAEGEAAADADAPAGPDEAAARSGLSMGRSYEKAQRPDLAIVEYRKVIEQHPGTEAADAARQALARLAPTQP